MATKGRRQKRSQRCKIMVVGGRPSDDAILFVQLTLLGFDEAEARQRIDRFRREQEAQTEESRR